MLHSGGLLCVALILIAPACMAAQARGVTIRISDRVSGLPLRNAEVIDRSNGRSRMTDDSGTVHLDWDGAELVRHRQPIEIVMVDDPAAKHNRRGDDAAERLEPVEPHCGGP